MQKCILCWINKKSKLRWAYHKSDINLKRVSKCNMAHHVQVVEHPNDSAFSSLQIFAIEMVLMKIFFLEERPGCNAVFVLIFKGL